MVSWNSLPVEITTAKILKSFQSQVSLIPSVKAITVFLFFFFALLHKVSEFGIQRYDIGYSMETIFGTPTQKVKFCLVKMLLLVLHLTKGETLEPPTSNLGDAKSR